MRGALILLHTHSDQSRQVSFAALPSSLAELKTLPEAALSRAVTCCGALDSIALPLAARREEAIRIINFLKGPGERSACGIQFISERISGNESAPLSCFDGARPENAYQPAQPYTLVISTVPASFAGSGYAMLYLRSGGADRPRPVKLRQKPSTGEWFLWEQMLLSQIRKPAAQDLWA